MEENRRGEGTMAESNKKESNALENRGQRLQQTQSLPQLQPGGTTPGDRWARDRLWYQQYSVDFSHNFLTKVGLTILNIAAIDLWVLYLE